MPKNIFVKSKFVALFLMSISSTSHAQNLRLPNGVKLVQKGAAIAGTPEAYKFQFSNGLKLIVLPDNRNPVAAMHTILDAGSNREEPGKTGLAHFFEHMMFRKTAQAEEGHFDRVLTGVGGSGNAGTSTDYVVYDNTFPGPALDIILDLEAARFKSLDVRDPYFTTEKGAVISERRLRTENDPSKRGAEVIRSIVERGTPYAWLVIGTKEDVANMSIEAAKSFYKGFYTPDNSIMAIGGPFGVEEVVQKVHARFGDWKGEVKEKHKPYPADYFTRDLGKSYICSEAVAQSNVQIIYPSSNSTMKDAVYALIFRNMLDDHPEGTFQRRLVKQKLATDFYFYKTTWQKRSQPLTAIFAMNPNQKFEPVQKFWDDAMVAIAKKPFDEKMKQRVLKSVALDEAETAQKMSRLVDTYYSNEFFYGDYLIGKSTAQIIKETSDKELKSWLEKSLAPKKYLVTGVVAKDQAPPCSTYAKTLK